MKCSCPLNINLEGDLFSLAVVVFAKMVNYCCVFGCNNEANRQKVQTKNRKKLSFYRIPRNHLSLGKKMKI